MGRPRCRKMRCTTDVCSISATSRSRHGRRGDDSRRSRISPVTVRALMFSIVHCSYIARLQCTITLGNMGASMVGGSELSRSLRALT